MSNINLPLLGLEIFRTLTFCFVFDFEGVALRPVRGGTVDDRDEDAAKGSCLLPNVDAMVVKLTALIEFSGEPFPGLLIP